MARSASILSYLAVVWLLLGVPPATAVTETQELTSSDTMAGDRLGLAVSISGDTTIIGADRQDDGGNNAGAAYVFTRTGSVWSEQQKLTAGDSEAGKFFGSSVSVFGDTAIVGAWNDDHAGFSSGSAYVFVRSGGVWTQQQRLVASDAATEERFGGSVSTWGDTVLVGAQFGNTVSGVFSGGGSAYVFERSGGVWTQEQELAADDAESGDSFGVSVCVSGTTAFVGSLFGDDGVNASGSVYVFERSGGVWAQVQELTATDAAIGDQFGRSVSVAGDTAVIGAYLDDDDGAASGSAYVFVRSSGVWMQEQKLTASDAASNDRFGYSVSISGDKAVVGALGDGDGGADSGSVYSFARSGGTWTQVEKLTASNASAGDEFGASVAVSGDTVVVGAPQGDGEEIDSGSAYLFEPDTFSPEVTAITPTTIGPTLGGDIDFTVTFDEDVANFDDDVTVTHSGTSDSGVSVAGGGDTYTVTVEGVSGDGSIAIAVDLGGDVQDLSGNPLLSSVTSAPVIIDNTPPIATMITPSTIGPIPGGDVAFAVTFNEDVQNFVEAADITITHVNSAHGGIVISGSGDAYTVLVTELSGSGSFTLSVNTGSDVQDLAGNLLTSSISSNSVAVDTVDPVVSSLTVTPSTASPNQVITISFEVSEPLVLPPNVTVNGTPAEVAKSVTFDYEYTVQEVDALGPATIEIGVVDAAGNMGVLSDDTSFSVVPPAAPLPLRSWPLVLALLMALLAVVRYRVSCSTN